ncbi:ELMO domain-containing protein 3 [Galendromus occidentalis]|uniref:ELMO domain-containing protein 3 n=1 Tax=Galendromus occidentalis TaxID=34638 RepID=A0AAJ7SI80_9ACAR|nr:ELMO domain-containing protein 3 [Galendromus occidentalis]
MVAVISMETLTEETEEELAAEQDLASLRTPVDDEIDGKFVAALEEWDAVGFKEIDPQAAIPYVNVPQCSRIITFEEAAESIVDSVNMEDHRQTIKPVVQRKGLKKWLYKLFGAEAMVVELIEERCLMFALAQVPFDSDSKCHNQMLQTIYRKLSNSTYDSPRFGAHWETIGFQGNDPATDLRGCGILGLLQLLYLSTHPDNEAVTKDIYNISVDHVQNFPFAVMGINMTKIALEALREDCLNKLCNRRRCVAPVLNDFYVGTYLIMFLSWQKSAATVSDTGHILQEVAKFVKASPSVVISNLEFYRENGMHNTFCEQHFTNLASV